MKKFTLSIIILFFVTLSHAQISLGLDGVYLFPLKNLDNRVDFGIGTSLTTSYTLENRINIGIGYEYLWFSSIIPDYVQQSEFLSIEYKFSEKEIIPYIGLKGGAYQTSYEAINSIIKENSFGLSPNIGLLISSGLFSKLYFNVNFSYTSIFNENSNEYLNFRFGVNYCFKK